MFLILQSNGAGVQNALPAGHRELVKEQSLHHVRQARTRPKPQPHSHSLGRTYTLTHFYI